MKLQCSNCNRIYDWIDILTYRKKRYCKECYELKLFNEQQNGKAKK